MGKHCKIGGWALWVVGAAMLGADATQAAAAAQNGLPPGVTQAFADRCESLNHLSLESVAETPGVIVSTAVVADRVATPQERVMFMKRGHSQGLVTPQLERFPVHCSVEGYVTPAVKFRIVLPPEEQWNGRFMLAACDAWCGRVGEDIAVPGLHAGYATITNDGGHYGRAPFDGVWAYNNLQGRIDFSYRANHVSAQVGKEIVKAFYGRAARYSYLTGFSKGGNAGLFAVQRYPEDFDGVFAKAPVVNYNPKNAAHFPWVALAVHPDGRTPLLYSDKIPLLVAGANAACDALDGLEDGVIDDPRKCEYDPIVLLCKPGQSEAKNECLNREQVEAVRKVYAKPVDDKGQVYFEYPTDVGSEHDWERSILPVRGSTEVGVPFALNGAATGIRYFVMKETPGPGYDWTQFDYVAEKAKIDEMSKIFDPDAVDLSAFKRRGGKLMMVHGWGDAMISAGMTIDWFEKVRARMGEEAVAEFARFYLVPGMNHGSGGSGPYVFETQESLVKWVEEGIAPGELLLEDGPAESTRRSRPMCPYPSYSRYRGQGDPDSAASFECVAP